MRSTKLFFLLVLLAVTTPAATLVQATNTNYATSSSTVQLAYASNVTSGNLLIVTVAHVGPDTSIVSGLTDTRGTTYIRALNCNDTASWYETSIWYGVAPSSGANTVTATLGGGATSATRRIVVSEFSGITSPTLDGTSCNMANDYTSPYEPTSNAITTTGNNALIYGSLSSRTTKLTTTASAGPGFTLASYTGDMQLFVHAEYQTQTTAGSIAATWTMDEGDDYLAAVAGFKGSAAPSTTSRRRIINQ